MTDNEYAPRPAAVVIERLRSAAGISVRSAARDAGLSEGRWRQIAKGYQRAAKGVDVPVNAPDATLARMAIAVGATTEDMVSVAEQGVADQMFDMVTAGDGPGYMLSASAYDHAIDVLRKWMENDAETAPVHPPVAALALWTPVQLAGALRQQVALLEQEFLAALRRSYGREKAAASDVAFDLEFAAHLAEPHVLRWKAAQDARAEGAAPPAIEHVQPDDAAPEDYLLAASDADHDPEVEAWREEP